MHQPPASSGLSPTAAAAPPPANKSGLQQQQQGDDQASAASTSSSSSSYHDQSSNDLTILSSAALITADCLGTGILALPADIAILGLPFGIAFLILNLPINLYAGTILGRAAGYVERRLLSGQVPDAVDVDAGGGENGRLGRNEGGRGRQQQQRRRRRAAPGYSSLETTAPSSAASASGPAVVSTRHTGAGGDDADEFGEEDEDDQEEELREEGCHPKLAAASATDRHQHRHRHHQSEVHTTDFIGMTTALFANPTAPVSSSPTDGEIGHHASTYSRTPTLIVTAVYYTNIFLVLGNYILVMSHAVSAMLGESTICLPTAGVVASVLMYALSQLRTMANLGRSASVVSLTALAIVVAQCLASIERGDAGVGVGIEEEDMEGAQRSNGQENGSDSIGSGNRGGASVPRQLAALASIGFAVGSQKLLLNIRHEMKVRENCAPKALGISLSVFGAAYVSVCLLAGPDPPAFLFDAIDEGPQRKLAGLLLWVHVAVSYAINSQALTSSIDRVHFHRITAFGLHDRHRLRWAVLTFVISLSSYFVANAVPFFKDLVALIGALTSVPLTLLLPAVLYRKVMRVPMFALGSWSSNRHDLASYLLVVFAMVFLLCGCFGAIDSIELDWEHHGKPFSCS